MLQKIVIHNYRVLRDFTLDFTAGMNILVGDNDAGKSTLLEAVNLALTGRVQSRQLSQDLSPYMFNLDTTGEFVAALKAGGHPQPPELIVDLYLDVSDALAGHSCMARAVADLEDVRRAVWGGALGRAGPLAGL